MLEIGVADHSASSMNGTFGCQAVTTLNATRIFMPVE